MGIDNRVERSKDRFFVRCCLFHCFVQRYEILVFPREVFYGLLFFSHMRRRLCLSIGILVKRSDTSNQTLVSLSHLQPFLELHPCLLHNSHGHNKHGVHKRHAILLFVLSPLHLLRRRCGSLPIECCH